MDSDRARALLEGERNRIEQAIARLAQTDAQALAAQSEPGGRDSQDLYENEFALGTAEDLAEQRASLERAEARLEAGTYGLSVASGQPIRDERLEVRPSAELTVEEEAAGGSLG